MDIEDMDANDALDTSNSATVDAAAAGADGAGTADAGSSSATDENDEGLLSVVRDVVDARTAPDAAASSADGTEGGSTADDNGGQAGPDNEQFSDVPFHKHPRFQELIAQRDGFREDAGRYQNVQAYLDQNNLSSDEAADALHTFARAKVDPAGAFAELKPWLQDLLVRAGEVLPDDLQARVQAGEITADVAQELSRERAKVKSHDSRQTFEQQRQERTTATNLARDLASTADTWAKDRRVKDPNFAAKEPLLMREIAYIQTREGKPTTVEGVQKQLKDAYEAVNKTFKAPVATPAAQARRPAIKPVTGGNVTGTVREKPKSTLDIIRANRRARTG